MLKISRIRGPRQSDPWTETAAALCRVAYLTGDDTAALVLIDHLMEIGWPLEGAARAARVIQAIRAGDLPRGSRGGGLAIEE